MKTANKKEKAKKVNFSLLAPQAESVSIAGDFNDWNPKSHPMKRDKKRSLEGLSQSCPRNLSVQILCRWRVAK